MDTKSLLADARAEDLPTLLGFQTACGKERLQTLFTKPLETNMNILQKKQDVIFAYKQSTKDHTRNERMFSELKEVEPIIQTILTPSPLEKESMEQILFSKNEHLQIFNTIPFFLMIVSFWKQYIVPILAICMPLIFFLFPYLTMKYYYGMNIPFQEYVKIFCITLGIPSSFENLQMKQSFQLIFTTVSLGQSIYQPIQTAFHIKKIDNELQEKTKALLKVKEIFESLFPDKKEILEDLSEEDTYKSFASGWDLPYRIQIALWMIGDMEVIHRIALSPSVQRVHFQRNKQVRMKHLLNPLLRDSKPVSFFLSKRRSHSLITGPNGGGKSSVLRCILVNVVFAQTVGICFGTAEGSFELDPFDWIQSGLHLEDLPGRLSLFEREVQFATQALQRARKDKNERGFLLFDELFHSTNPPDGERTARIFLEQVWSFPNLSSMISTHVFSLAESSPKNIQKLCVPAEKNAEGKIHFTYNLQSGICKVSSVDLVLEKCGFFPPGKPGGEKE